MTHPTAVRQEAIERLHAAPWNPRQIKDERFKNLVRSIQADPDFLHHRPILATADGTIYAGNMRYRAAQHLGMATVPAIIEDIPEQLAKERALRDNAQWGEWTEQDLAELIYELGEAGSDTDLLGFDADEIARLMVSVGAVDEPFTDPDAVPDIPEEPTTKRGDLWLLGEHRVLCGDSTSATDVERLMYGETAAIVFTDPPYGIDYRDMRGHEAIANDSSPGEALAVFGDALAMAGEVDAVFACCDWRSMPTIGAAMAENGLAPKCCIVWDKERGVQNLDRYHKQHEMILYSGPYGGQKTVAGDVWRFPRDFDPDHPTPKPVGLVERAVETSTARGAVVYDPFLSSGTTLIACEQLARKCYGMEIEPKYVDVIVRRWEEFTGRKAVLDGSPD